MKFKFKNTDDLVENHYDIANSRDSVQISLVDG